MEKEKVTKKKVSTKAKTTKKKVKKQPKEKFMAGIKKELKQVKWPTAKEILKYTLATIMFCIVLVIFFEILNLILAFVKGMFN